MRRELIAVASAVILLILVGPLLIKLLVAAVAALVAALVAPVLFVGLMGAAILVDPMLVAVTEDGYWVVVDQWWS
jgi:hypothetical protein